ncbi:hypothetical protein [Paenibacillus sp.]|uniref:hypothetical protein n=1 Tax=Paenibacillus sp. TaxID=58172 RepID=UPI00283A9666|nr:hypothetical protein [Paenibacillus sp.]
MKSLIALQYSISHQPYCYGSPPQDQGATKADNGHVCINLMPNHIPIRFPSHAFETGFFIFRAACISEPPPMNSIIPMATDVLNNKGFPQPCRPIIPVYAHIVPKKAMKKNPLAIPRTAALEIGLNR